MSDGKLNPLPTFWERNSVSKTSYYYLRRLGRAPREIHVGSKVLISPEAEAEWRKAMAENPITGSLRKLVLAAEAS